MWFQRACTSNTVNGDEVSKVGLMMREILGLAPMVDCAEIRMVPYDRWIKTGPRFGC